MSCSTWCSGQTGDDDTPGSGHNCSLCHQNAAMPKSSSSTASQSTVASAKRYVGGAGPGGGSNAQPGWQDTCARHGVESEVLGAQTSGELARPHTTFVHPLTVPKPAVPNHRARRKGPTGSSKDSDQVSLEAGRRFCKGEMRLHEAQDSDWPASPPYTATGPPGPIS